MAEVFDFGLQQHKIKMDGKFFENNLFAVAGDTGRRLEVQLLDSSNMVQDTTGISLRLNANVAGQSTYAQATLTEATKGLYDLDLPNGMLIAPGNWQFQWQIIGSGGEKLHSFAFTGSIGSNLSEGGTQGKNFYLNLEDLKAMQADFVNGTIDSAILQTDIADKLTTLEETYAPKLTEVTAQLAHTENTKADVVYVDQQISTMSGGAIKGTYTTLTALKTAYENGATGPFLVEEDGNRYIWDVNKLDWVSIGVYEPAEIADKTISTVKLNFPVVEGENSTNLFDKTDVKNSYYVDSVTGSDLVAMAEPKTNYNASNWIVVAGISKISVRYINQYHFYDSNKLPISGGSNTNRPGILTVPLSAYYFKITVLTQYLNTQQINMGEVLLEYELGKNKVTNTQIKNKTLTQNKFAFPVVVGKESTNLFDKKKITGSIYIAWNTGKETVPSVEPRSNYNASEYIYVSGKQQLTVKFLKQVAFYDIDKVYISGNSSDNTTQTINIPIGAYYFRATVMKPELDSQQIVFGSVLGEYENAGNLMNGDQIETKSITIDKFAFELDNSKLKKPYQLFGDFILNKKTRIKLIGDSITHGTGGTGFAEDGEQIANTSNLTSPNSHSWANSFRDAVKKVDNNIEVINWAIFGKPSSYYVANITQFITSDDDLVIMQLGTNDRSNCQNWEESSANLKSIVDYAHSLNVPIILMSANPVTVLNDNSTSTQNFNMFEVNLAVKQAAYYSGVEHISNYDAFLRYEEYTGNSMDGLLADNLHPNNSGHDLMFRNTARDLGISYVRNGVTT